MRVYGNPHFGDSGSIGRENLIAGDFPRHTDTVTLAKGQSLKAGSVLGEVSETGEYLLSAKVAQDGSQNPLAILQVDADASDGAIRAPVWFTGCFNEDALAFGKDHNKQTTKAALRANSIFLKSVVGA